MIRHEAKQGTREWALARAGVPTASGFSRIVTPKKMTASTSQDGYLHQLIAEWLIGLPVDDGGSGFMERGTYLEGMARSWYELQRDTTVETVGLCLRDDRRAGCSPDGLVGEDGGLEIKCPSAEKHVSYLIEAPDDYKCQVQGNLWITGRKWWDFVSYNPDLPSALYRFERQDAFIAVLEEHVLAFADRLEQEKTKLLARGISPRGYASTTRASDASTARGNPSEDGDSMARGRTSRRPRVGSSLRWADPEPF